MSAAQAMYPNLPSASEGQGQGPIPTTVSAGEAIYGKPRTEQVPKPAKPERRWPIHVLPGFHRVQTGIVPAAVELGKEALPTLSR
jgi:hypothetical protein